MRKMRKPVACLCCDVCVSAQHSFNIAAFNRPLVVHQQELTLSSLLLLPSLLLVTEVSKLVLAPEGFIMRQDPSLGKTLGAAREPVHSQPSQKCSAAEAKTPERR